MGATESVPDEDDYYEDVDDDLSTTDAAATRNHYPQHRASGSPRPSPTAKKLGGKQLRSSMMHQKPIKRLKGCVMGGPKTGKHTLLARLTGKDPFAPDAPSDPPSSVTTPYNAPPDEVTWDRILLEVEASSVSFEDRVDFCVILLSPRHDLENTRAYIINVLTQYLRLMGYPHDKNKERESLSLEPISVSILFNFEDLKRPFPRDDIVQLVEELLAGVPSQYREVQFQSTCLRNCYGLNVLHHFIYRVYLQRKRFVLEQQLQQVSTQRKTTRPPKPVDYDDFVKLIQSPKKTKTRSAPKKPEIVEEKSNKVDPPPLQQAKRDQQELQQQPSKRELVPKPPILVGRDALEAFLASDDEEDEVPVKSAAERKKYNSLQSGGGTDDDDSDDEDDFFYDDNGNRISHRRADMDDSGSSSSSSSDVDEEEKAQMSQIAKNEVKKNADTQNRQAMSSSDNGTKALSTVSDSRKKNNRPETTEEKRAICKEESSDTEESSQQNQIVVSKSQEQNHLVEESPGDDSDTGSVGAENHATKSNDNDESKEGSQDIQSEEVNPVTSLTNLPASVGKKDYDDVENDEERSTKDGWSDDSVDIGDIDSVDQMDNTSKQDQKKTVTADDSQQVTDNHKVSDEGSNDDDQYDIEEAQGKAASQSETPATILEEVDRPKEAAKATIASPNKARVDEDDSDDDEFFVGEDNGMHDKDESVSSHQGNEIATEKAESPKFTKQSPEKLQSPAPVAFDDSEKDSSEDEFFVGEEDTNINSEDKEANPSLLPAQSSVSASSPPTPHEEKIAKSSSPAASGGLSAAALAAIAAAQQEAEAMMATTATSPAPHPPTTASPAQKKSKKEKKHKKNKDGEPKKKKDKKKKKSKMPEE